MCLTFKVCVCLLSNCWPIFLKSCVNWLLEYKAGLSSYPPKSYYLLLKQF